MSSKMFLEREKEVKEGISNLSRNEHSQILFYVFLVASSSREPHTRIEKEFLKFLYQFFAIIITFCGSVVLLSRARWTSNFFVSRVKESSSREEIGMCRERKEVFRVKNSDHIACTRYQSSFFARNSIIILLADSDRERASEKKVEVLTFHIDEEREELDVVVFSLSSERVMTICTCLNSIRPGTSTCIMCRVSKNALREKKGESKPHVSNSWKVEFNFVFCFLREKHINHFELRKNKSGENFVCGAHQSCLMLMIINHWYLSAIFFGYHTTSTHEREIRGEVDSRLTSELNFIVLADPRYDWQEVPTWKWVARLCVIGNRTRSHLTLAPGKRNKLYTEQPSVILNLAQVEWETKPIDQYFISLSTISLLLTHFTLNSLKWYKLQLSAVERDM